MVNRWGIPKEVENFVKQRDTNCVYCGQFFLDQPESSKHKQAWEHIVNDFLCCMVS